MWRFVTVLLAAGTLACGGGEGPARDDADRIAFVLEDAGHSGTRHKWIATHESGCRFGLELEIPDGVSSFAFADGAFFRHGDRDCDALVASAARVLAGGGVPKPAQGYRRMPFGTVVLGRDLSRGQGKDQLAGEFTSEPKGGWVATKAFLGEEQAEFFLNVNPGAHRGEITLKDPDYGRDAVRLLAQALTGPVTMEAPPAPTPAPTPAPEPTADPRVAASLATFNDPAVRQPERRKALESVVRYGRGTLEPALAVKAALRDADSMIRFDAMLLVGRVDPKLETVREEVAAALKAGDRGSKMRAGQYLAAAGYRDGVAEAMAALLDGDEGFAAGAAQVLGTLGADAAPAVPGLIKLSAPHKHPYTRVAAIQALGAIGAPAAPAMSLLRVYAKDQRPGVAEAARAAVAQLEAAGVR